MAYSDLRDFIDALEKNKELKRISVEVDPVLEITEFADRAVKHGGPALLFEKPKGSRIPVLINAFASMRRMELALEVDSVESIAQRISEFLEMRMPEGLIGKLKMLPKLAEVGAFFPEDGFEAAHARMSSGTIIFRSTNFRSCTAGRRMAAASSRLPMVFSRNPDTGKRNCGCYRMQVYDERTTGMHWQTHKQGAEHYRRLLKEGKTARMDVAVAIGSDPATMYSAILPLPPDLDEMMIAGFLRGKPVEMVKCETVGSGGAGQCGDRAGRLCRDWRDARRRTVWRSHRLLFARRRISGVPHHLHHASQASDLCDDHRRAAADGGFLHGQGHRADLSAADAPATAGDPRHLRCRPRAFSTT